jgi:hypothetical protein
VRRSAWISLIVASTTVIIFVVAAAVVGVRLVVPTIEPVPSPEPTSADDREQAYHELVEMTCREQHGVDGIGYPGCLDRSLPYLMKTYPDLDEATEVTMSDLQCMAIHGTDDENYQALEDCMVAALMQHPEWGEDE